MKINLDLPIYSDCFKDMIERHIQIKGNKNRASLPLRAISHANHLYGIAGKDMGIYLKTYQWLLAIKDMQQKVATNNEKLEKILVAKCASFKKFEPLRLMSISIRSPLAYALYQLFEAFDKAQAIAWGFYFLNVYKRQTISKQHEEAIKQLNRLLSQGVQIPFESPSAIELDKVVLEQISQASARDEMPGLSKAIQHQLQQQ